MSESRSGNRSGGKESKTVVVLDVVQGGDVLIIDRDREIGWGARGQPSNGSNGDGPSMIDLAPSPRASK